MGPGVAPSVDRKTPSHAIVQGRSGLSTGTIGWAHPSPVPASVQVAPPSSVRYGPTQNRSGSDDTPLIRPSGTPVTSCQVEPRSADRYVAPLKVSSYATPPPANCGKKIPETGSGGGATGSHVVPPSVDRSRSFASGTWPSRRAGSSGSTAS